MNNGGDYMVHISITDFMELYGTLWNNLHMFWFIVASNMGIYLKRWLKHG